MCSPRLEPSKPGHVSHPLPATRRAQYDADQLQDAKRTLTKALHLAPADNNLRFNVALTLQVGLGLPWACTAALQLLVAMSP